MRFQPVPAAHWVMLLDGLCTASLRGSSDTLPCCFSVLLSPSQLSGHFHLKVPILCNRGCLFVITSVVTNLRRLTRLTESEQCCQKMINKQCLLTEKNCTLHFNCRCQWQSAYSFLQGIYFLIKHVASWPMFISNVLFRIIHICQNRKAWIYSSFKPHYLVAIIIWRQYSRVVKKHRLWSGRVLYEIPVLALTSSVVYCWNLVLQILFPHL